MGVKSYIDKIKTNWDEISPERQSELKATWSEHTAELFMRRIRQYPQEYQKAIYYEVVKQLATTN